MTWEERYVSRKEFQEILRKELIPWFNNNGLSDFIQANKEMFYKWTFCFYDNQFIYIKD